MIDGILKGPKFNLKSATHEPYLYRGEIDGDSVLLLRQMDDFSMASLSEAIANKTFSILQADLKQPLKLLGLLSMYNGLDISQSNRFVKVSCATYLRKILKGHGCEKATQKSHIASPMNQEEVPKRTRDFIGAHGRRGTCYSPEGDGFCLQASDWGTDFCGNYVQA